MKKKLSVLQILAIVAGGASILCLIYAGDFASFAMYIVIGAVLFLIDLLIRSRKAKDQKAQESKVQVPFVHQQAPMSGHMGQSITKASEDYEQLCSAFRIYEDAPRGRNRYDAGINVMGILQKCEPYVNQLILQGSELNSPYRRHAVFGYLFKDNPIEELKEKVNRDIKQLTFILNKSAAFSNEVSSIPRHTITLDHEFELSRNALAEMPEITYSPIGQAFSLDKLPSFIVIDAETTGVNVQGGRIVELSAVLYEDFVPVSAFTTLINPQKPIPADATKINGITDAMVADAPTLAQVAPDFLRFISKHPIVGYNLPFDLKFLWSQGVDFTQQKRKYYDVLPLCRKVYKKDLETFTLEDLCEFHKIYRLDAHRSLSDCVATEKVFVSAVEDLT